MEPKPTEPSPDYWVMLTQLSHSYSPVPAPHQSASNHTAALLICISLWSHNCAVVVSYLEVVLHQMCLLNLPPSVEKDTSKPCGPNTDQ